MAISARLRFEVFHRDDFTCQYCGRMAPDVVLEVDHMLSRHDGGSDEISNLIAACFECNRGKSSTSVVPRDQSFEEYRQRTMVALDRASEQAFREAQTEELLEELRSGGDEYDHWLSDQEQLRHEREYERLLEREYEQCLEATVHDSY